MHHLLLLSWRPDTRGRAAILEPLLLLLKGWARSSGHGAVLLLLLLLLLVWGRPCSSWRELEVERRCDDVVAVGSVGGSVGSHLVWTPGRGADVRTLRPRPGPLLKVRLPQVTERRLLANGDQGQTDVSDTVEMVRNARAGWGQTDGEDGCVPLEVSHVLERVEQMLDSLVGRLCSCCRCCCCRTACCRARRRWTSLSARGRRRGRGDAGRGRRGRSRTDGGQRASLVVAPSSNGGRDLCAVGGHDELELSGSDDGHEGEG